jgi:hypothetical protein
MRVYVKHLCFPVYYLIVILDNQNRTSLSFRQFTLTSRLFKARQEQTGLLGTDSQTQRIKAVPGKLTVARLAKQSPPFMEAEGSLPHSMNHILYHTSSGPV